MVKGDNVNAVKGGERLSATGLSFLSASSETKVLQSGASLQIQEGESLRLVCVADSNPSAMLSWKRQTQKNFRLSKGDELQLPRVELEDQGKYICQAKNSLGTQTASVSLSIRSELENDGGWGRVRHWDHSLGNPR